MAYTLSNKCAKNLSKRTVLLQLIIKNVVTCFFGTQCRLLQSIRARNYVTCVAIAVYRALHVVCLL